jgi:hypothetical protein
MAWQESVSESGGIESNCTHKGAKTNKTGLSFQGLIHADSLAGNSPSRHHGYMMQLSIVAE